ncbi:conjugal transfer protein TraG, partial [Burkholderia sp. SIMBA_051]
PALAVGRYTDAPPLRPNDWVRLAIPTGPAASIAAGLIGDDTDTADDSGPGRQPELSEVFEYGSEPQRADSDLALLDDD